MHQNRDMPGIGTTRGPRARKAPTARMTLGGEVPFTAARVGALRERQRQHGVPEKIEWVHETTPTLLAAAREAGLLVEELPLLVLPGGAAPIVPPTPAGARVNERVGFARVGTACVAEAPRG